MKCPKCEIEVKCYVSSDMLNYGYITEKYRCDKCNGDIEVLYKDFVNLKDIKSMKYTQ